MNPHMDHFEKWHLGYQRAAKRKRRQDVIYWWLGTAGLGIGAGILLAMLAS